MSKSDGAGSRADDQDFIFDPTLAAEHPKIKSALAYWVAKCGDRFAPSRGEIDAREAKAFLAHLQLFDILQGGRAFRSRLVGTEIVRVLKENTTGKIFDDTSPQPVVRRVLRAVRWVMEHRKPLRTLALRTRVEGQDYLSHETLFLPLSNDGETIDMMAVVGVFTPVGPR
ncbi:MAG: PAS domain-containing protein [Alphaproteobacteria bacterium]|nr:PAS domain-containing protein [Alphaproteobacteria bacterium]